MLIDHDADDDVLDAAVAAADADAIAFAEHAVRLGVLAVDLDLAALARALGFRARLEQTRDVEPDVQANRRRSRQIRISILPLVLRPFDEGVGLLLAIHALEVLLELRPHFVERHRPRRLLLGDLDDVEAELGLDEIADRARRELERHVVERTDHLALLEEAEVAAVLRAARIL